VSSFLEESWKTTNENKVRHATNGSCFPLKVIAQTAYLNEELSYAPGTRLFSEKAAALKTIASH
jgi:hypothetical protein